MKRYRYILLLFLSVCILCLAVGYGVTRMAAEQETAPSHETESVPETETARDSHLAEEWEEEQAETANQDLNSRYYLVAEDGFLLVFPREGNRVCMYTHVPITDFPEEEQERLRAGISFASMLDIFNYLESYTS